MAYRIQLAYESDSFNALFNVHGRDLDGTATLFRANVLEPGTNDFVSGFDREVENFDEPDEQALQSTGMLARLEWNLANDLTLTSITAYERE